MNAEVTIPFAMLVCLVLLVCCSLTLCLLQWYQLRWMQNGGVRKTNGEWTLPRKDLQSNISDLRSPEAL